MIQHLIEKCLVLELSQAECIASLARSARIKPAITLAVWNALEKENPVFFRDYNQKPLSPASRMANRQRRVAAEEECAGKILKCLELWRIS
ncbi:hypothetical protein CLOM_g12120 [Closterium sp. NIES-68]|nr:hypothetical protein CLOM_g12120 [Closterium sp. NIES-68]